MSLNMNNQLDLLHDLLSLQAEECCGSTSECQQISRLIKSIQENPNIQQSKLFEHLDFIYQYSTVGESSANLNQHIEYHQHDIENWLQAIKDSNY
ncbi:YtzH-like family protein [Gracilibacillus sp. YIM 98692]|uniref:YtzH-like family protein n=1 Tax=Gracilibacillus sp. YIM 98692 TaxID=2663532 RepID=UPI0013CF5E83|nr:YtzH-like family protein [Gracilibacillus sp. YIM 98692]